MLLMGASTRRWRRLLERRVDYPIYECSLEEIFCTTGVALKRKFTAGVTLDEREINLYGDFYYLTEIKIHAILV